MTPRLAAYWRRLASGRATSPTDRLLLFLLIPLSLPYALLQRLRAFLYRCGLLTTQRLPRPVISVGNLTVGGTGKTPVSAFIARHLLDQGLKVAVLSRGYGGRLEGQCAVVSDGQQILLTAEECGDEPYLLASTVPGLMVVIGSDRYSAGRLAMEQLAPDLFLLDDGFQHLRLHRDLNILLLDHDHPFGNGWTLPAGLLREAGSAADRADLIMLTRCLAHDVPLPGLPVRPVCCARHRLDEAVPLAGGVPQALTDIAGQRIVAFAGIAEPQAFFDGLCDRGLNIVATIPLPDHARYDAPLFADIRRALTESSADLLVTTEKDGVKLRDLPEELARITLLARLNLSISDPAPLITALSNLLQK